MGRCGGGVFRIDRASDTPLFLDLRLIFSCPGNNVFALIDYLGIILILYECVFVL